MCCDPLTKQNISSNIIPIWIGPAARPLPRDILRQSSAMPSRPCLPLPYSFRQRLEKSDFNSCQKKDIMPTEEQCPCLDQISFSQLPPLPPRPPLERTDGRTWLSPGFRSLLASEAFLCSNDFSRYDPSNYQRLP